MELLLKYFPTLTQTQIEQYASLQRIYTEWNEKINVISRRDIDNLYERHVLHSLSIAKFIQFNNAAKILDLGTGGGFPGVPLAIMFPTSRFHLVDSIGKKLKVIEAVKEAIGLTNVFTFHSRVEQMEFQYDFIVSRAVAPISDLLQWTKGKYFSKDQRSVKNGLFWLKGGSLESENLEINVGKKISVSSFFDQQFFKDKFIIYKEQ
jgi:16S rRNA (guanine527-N7)-methyltransferase